jgi:hypothetical protein
MIFSKKALLAICTLFIAHTALAWDTGGCSSMINNGWFKKYKYQGVDGAAGNATTKDNFKGTSATSTEGSTASVDPKVWSNRSTSGIQYSSSWGKCSLFANEIRDNREKYFVQNKDEILKDIATGQGEHVKVLASFSLCDEAAVPAYGAQLQKNISKLITPAASYNQALDEIVEQDPVLSSKCGMKSSIN